MKQPKITVKLPRLIPVYEMEVIIGGKKQGMTQKETKILIDNMRRAKGTFKGKGISTNTISRLLGKTHGETYFKQITYEWKRYEGREKQKSMWDEVREQIKDPVKRKKADKAMKRVIERSAGRQSELDIDYNPIEDYFEFTS